MPAPAEPPPPRVNVEKLLPSLRRAALAAPLAALDDWWLNVRCVNCRGSMSYPLRLLIERHGRGTPAAAVARLRCKHCRGRPASVQLTDDPASGSNGGPPHTWRVELLPVPEG